MTDIGNKMDVGTYTDFTGLNSLHSQATKDPEGAKKEVAEQFESLLVQILMKSMREANQALSSDPNSDQQGALYTDLFDKQLSLVISHSGTGLASVIEESLRRDEPVPTTPNTSTTLSPLTFTSSTKETKIEPVAQKISALDSVEKKEANASFDSSDDFIKALWSSAKTAASILGADPKLLLAQAALETNWGKNILSKENGQSTHNLFNIKADKSWDLDSVQVDAIEHEDGILVKNKSKFRAYDSYNDSFSDYVHFLKNNTRYQEALKHASDPRQFTEQLQKAKYATDEKYSEKILQIYSGKRLQHVIAEQEVI